MNMRKETKAVVNRNYKDTLFRMIFKEKKELLSLYNAVNQTAYDNPEELEIVTLENAIYMNIKNDVAFIMDFQMYLYEHQSTYNPNIPLRDLFYVTREYEVLVDKKNLYGTKVIKIPTPNFFVFYNGQENRPEREIYCLSDAFEKQVTEPSLELKVQVLNINVGMNQTVLNACKTLKDYSIYVEKVRTLAKLYPLERAVEAAVDECIENGVLEEILRKSRAEVISMSIFEYNEEETLKQLRRDYKEEGIEEGIRIGREEGERILSTLLTELFSLGRVADAELAIKDKNVRENLYREFKLKE